MPSTSLNPILSIIPGRKLLIKTSALDISFFATVRSSSTFKSKSIDNENEWIYIERVLVKGEYHKLGRNILKSSKEHFERKYDILQNFLNITPNKIAAFFGDVPQRA